MRKNLVWLCALSAVCLTEVCRADRPWLVGEHGDFSRIEFRGNDSFPAGHLVAALDSDFALLAPSRPLASLASLITTIETQLTHGYHHQGFADAAIEVGFDDEQQRIIVDITEGEQFKNGPVAINGVNVELAQLLISRLTEAGPQPLAPPANPQSPETALAAATAQQQQALWKDDEPTSFTTFTKNQLTQRAIETLHRAGYLEAFIELDLRPDAATARTELWIAVAPGPAAVIGAIEVVGVEQHSPAEIQEYLGIEAGQTCDLFSRRSWEHQLEASGRFATHAVTTMPMAGRPGSHIVRIGLIECEEVPTLHEELSEVDLALLRAGEWLAHPENFDGDICIHGEGDLQALCGYLGSQPVDEAVEPSGPMSAAGDADAAPQWPVWVAAGSRFAFDLVMSPQGQSLLDVAVSSRDNRPLFGYGIELSEGKTSIWSAGNRNSLGFVTDDAPLPSANITFIRTPTSPEGHKFSMTFGMGVSSQSGGVLQIRLTPAFILSQAHSDSAHSEIRDGVLHGDWEGVRSQFDVATGRLIRLECFTDDDVSLSVEIQEDGLAAARANRGRNSVELTELNRGQPPAMALCEFLSEEVAWWARQLGHDVESARWVAVTRLLRTLDEHDNFETVSLTATGNEGKFFIPASEALAGNPLSWVGQFVLWGNAAVLSRGSPAWQVGREAVAAMILHDATALAELERLSRDPRCGPLTSLYAAELLRYVHPALQKAWADQGLRRLDAVSLSQDLNHLTQGDTPVARFLIQIVSELDRFPAEDLQAVFAGVGDETVRHAIAIVTESSIAPETRVQQLVQLFWMAGLQDIVEDQLAEHLQSGMETTQR